MKSFFFDDHIDTIATALVASGTDLNTAAPNSICCEWKFIDPDDIAQSYELRKKTVKIVAISETFSDAERQ